MLKNNEILLTIAIPTYNRSYTLEKILKQLSLEDKTLFNIIVSDDYSTDDTKDVVIKYQKLLPNLIYKKNKTNLGYSANVCRAYELAKTRYVWFLCDDDTVLPGAVTKIVKAIKEYEPTVAIFNCTWVDSYGRKLIAGVKHDILYQDIKELKDYQTLMKTSYLSILVFEKRLSIDRLKQQNYRDNIYFQISLSLLLLSNKFRLCEIASTIVYRNVGYKYGEFFKFCIVDHLKSIYIIKHKFDNKRFVNWSKKKLPIILQLYLSQKIGLFKYNKKMTIETRNLIFEYYGFFYGLIMMSFPIIKLIIPTFLIKSLYLIRLTMIHGYKMGVTIYKKNINRAFKDERKTGFVKYR